MHRLVIRMLASAPVYNLLHPAVFVRWACALGLLTAVLWIAWNAARALVGPWPGRSAGDAFVIYTGTGVAMAAGVMSVLCLAGAYTIVPVGVVALAGLVAPALVERSPRAALAFWPNLRDTIREEPWGLGFMLACSIGVLLPPFRGDEISYHLAYPQQWVAAGRVTVDPFMQYPLYTFNWQVLRGGALMLHSEALAHLLSWFCAALAALTVRLMLDRLDVRPAIGRVAFFAVALTPLIQRYATVALVDVPLMAFLTLTTYALMALRDVERPRPRLAIPAALTAGMFLGMKVINLAYVPLFATLAAFRLRGVTRLAYFGICLGFGSLWYLRTYALSGDPMLPLLSRALHRPALYWSAEDIQAQTTDLHRGLSYAPADLARLPVRLITATDDGPLRDRPLLGYALLMPLTVLLVPTLRRQRALDPLVTMWFAVAVWTGTAYLIRYAVFAPLAVVCAALLIDRALRRLAPHRRVVPEWIVAALLIIGPTPAALRYLPFAFDERIELSPHERLSRTFACGDAECWLTAFERDVRTPASVYALTAPGVYYYQEAGFHVVSGPFHAGRWVDFLRSADSGQLAPYLARVGAQYLVVSPVMSAQTFSRSPDSLLASVTRQLPPPIYHDGAITIFRTSER
jgi:hypothetical protein